VTRDGDESVTTENAGPGAARALVLDFDGTITEVDLLQEVSVRFGNPQVVREVEGALVEGRISLREEITREFAPVRAPLDEVVRWVLANVRIRQGFRELVELARMSDWPVLILSSGFHELIEPVLAREGVEAEVKANRIDARPDGWRVLWRDGSVCPVCGQPCKRAALPSHRGIVYIGDGYSDRCAALAADLVFATRGLARYLDGEGVAYEPFVDFFDVARGLGV
jgi:2-hydroxy-3-keto-5-methylthiopentenyl-1-phosphate phosphatase